MRYLSTLTWIFCLIVCVATSKKSDRKFINGTLIVACENTSNEEDFCSEFVFSGIYNELDEELTNIASKIDDNEWQVNLQLEDNDYVIYPEEGTFGEFTHPGFVALYDGDESAYSWVLLVEDDTFRFDTDQISLIVDEPKTFSLGKADIVVTRTN